MVLLVVTIEFAPIAVAFVIPATPLALMPTNVFWFSAVFDAPAFWPFVLACPAPWPKKAFRLPVLLLLPALKPKKALFVPTFTFPAAIPAKRFDPPVLCRMRKPPMLYCVAVLTAFADRVPPAVPSPLMLKLLDACCVVVF